VKRKAVTVTPAAIRAAARQNTKASARLEGREVPADFIPRQPSSGTSPSAGREPLTRLHRVAKPTG
jgi:hypothetical protein